MPLGYWPGSQCSAHVSCKMQGAFQAQTHPCLCTLFSCGGFLLVCYQQPAHSLSVSIESRVCAAISLCVQRQHTDNLAWGEGRGRDLTKWSCSAVHSLLFHWTVKLRSFHWSLYELTYEHFPPLIVF